MPVTFRPDWILRIARPKSDIRQDSTYAAAVKLIASLIASGAQTDTFGTTQPKTARPGAWTKSPMMVTMTIMASPLTFQAGDVISLTGLSPSQLREWTSRRGIVPADQPALGRGKHARYAWNTVLVLRILIELKRSFGIEIAAWAEIGTCLRDSLTKTSPIALYGKYIVFQGKAFEITTAPGIPNGATIAIPLDGHLEVLTAGLGVPPPPSQLSLFPVARA